MRWLLLGLVLGVGLVRWSRSVVASHRMTRLEALRLLGIH